MKNISIDLELIIIAFLVIAILLITMPSVSQKHICKDETHKICDGNCICDGMECGRYELDTDGVVSYYTPPKAVQFVNARDYQLDISSIPDSIIIMDGHRYVGTIPMWDKSPLDSVLWKDNE